MKNYLYIPSIILGALSICFYGIGQSYAIKYAMTANIIDNVCAQNFYIASSLTIALGVVGITGQLIAQYFESKTFVDR